MPLRSGAFRTGLSPFGAGILPPYQSSSDYTVVQPPGSTPPRSGPPPAGSKPPPKGGTIPKQKHVAVRGVPRPTSTRPKPPIKRPPRPTRILAPHPKPVTPPGGGGLHYKI